MTNFVVFITEILGNVFSNLIVTYLVRLFDRHKDKNNRPKY